MTEVKISIIVPVNDVEGYLRSCLDTLINQSFKDIEIICIDDGSKDNSLNILKEYSASDSRIKILSEPERKGQAYARNVGLKIAKGEYIGFVDGDDWVELDMFEKLYQSASSYDTDITMCATHLHNEYTQKSSHNIPYYNLSNFSGEFDNRAFSPEETKDFILDLNVAIWNKIYKKDFLQKIKASFKEGYIYEDLPFFYETYLKAKKVSIVRDFLYFYRSNRIGSTMSNLGAKVLDRIDMVSCTYESLKSTPFYNQIRNNIVGWVINDLFHRYTLVDKKYQKEFYFKMQKVFKSLDIEGIDIEVLKSFYFYEEFILVRKSTFVECNNSLFLRYKNAKQRIKEIKHRRNLSHQSIMEFYESKLFEAEVASRQEHSQELKNQKEWYEKRIKEETDVLKNSIETKYIDEIHNQKELYEKLLTEQKELMNRQNEQIARQKEAEYNDKIQQKDAEILEIKNDCQKEIQNQLESQQKWLENDFDRIKNEIDEWHFNNLEQKLSEQKTQADIVFNNQKEYYEQKITELKQNSEEELFRMKNFMEDQKKYYQKELEQVKIALTVVKKFKKIKLKIKNRIKL